MSRDDGKYRGFVLKIMDVFQDTFPGLRHAERFLSYGGVFGFIDFSRIH